MLCFVSTAIYSRPYVMQFKRVFINLSGSTVRLSSPHLKLLFNFMYIFLITFLYLCINIKTNSSPSRTQVVYKKWMTCVPLIYFLRKQLRREELGGVGCAKSSLRDQLVKRIRHCYSLERDSSLFSIPHTIKKAGA